MKLNQIRQLGKEMNAADKRKQIKLVKTTTEKGN